MSDCQVNQDRYVCSISSFTDMEHHLRSQTDAPMQVQEEYQRILATCVAVLSKGRDRKEYHIESPIAIEQLGIPRLPMVNSGTGSAKNAQIRAIVQHLRPLEAHSCLGALPRTLV